MAEQDEKIRVMILQILREADGVEASQAITRALEEYGVSLSPRTVRLYLKQMEADGLVGPARMGRSGGRTITAKGIREINDSLVFNWIGYTAAKVDGMAWQMDFDLASRTGRIVLNLTIVHKDFETRALQEMMGIFRLGYGMGQYVALFQPKEMVGKHRIPPHHIGIGTICSVTVNGVFLSHRLPVVSRFGGVLEIHQGSPVRFTDVIGYEGTTLDPLEVFIKAGLTSVRAIDRLGRGRIGASFRELPACAAELAWELHDTLEAAGLGGILTIGKPGQSLLGVPVNEGRIGMIVTGGLNPVAAIEEASIPTVNIALACLCEFDRLIHYQDLMEQLYDTD